MLITYAKRVKWLMYTMNLQAFIIASCYLGTRSLHFVTTECLFDMIYKCVNEKKSVHAAGCSRFSQFLFHSAT